MFDKELRKLEESLKKPRLLFDLDETIYMGDIIKVARAQLVSEGVVVPELDGKDAVDYLFSNFPEVLRERIIKLFSDPFHACLNKYALPGIYPFLFHAECIKHYKIGYVTSRPANLKEFTDFVLYRDFPGIIWSGRYFSNKTNTLSPNCSKVDCIKDFQPTHYFDDHWDYCLEAVKVGVPNVYLITNSHTGWNHKYVEKAIFANIKPVKSILELDLR